MTPRSLLVLLALAPAVSLSAAELWPQWRGPTRDGLVKTTFPASLEGGALTSLWKVELDNGYSSPVVSANLVYTVETRGGKEEVVRALDRKTGRQAWEASWPGSMVVPFFAWRNGSWVRATPALDGDTLFVAGMRDVLVALDARTGKERWRVDFVERYKSPLPDFGFVSSPLVVGEHLYVQAGAGFVKLDKKTGASAWRTLEDGGGMWGSAFSSPVFATLAGRPQVVVHTRNEVAGVDPQTGRPLWRQKVPAFRGMNILNPVVFGDGVLTSSYGGATLMWGVKDAADGPAVAEAWKLPIQGYMSTPVVIDGHAYLHRRDRKLCCIDLRAGRETWAAAPRLSDYVSLVSDGKRVLGLDSRGELLLFRADPAKFDLLDRRHVTDQEAWAHLAVCGDEVFVRSQRGVEAFRWK